MILTATTDTLEAFTDATATTTEPAFLVNYADNTTSAFTPGRQNGVLNGTTDVTVLSAPASSTQRVVKSINICNVDTVSHDITIQFDDNATERILADAITVAAGETLYWNAESGWIVQPFNQVFKTLTIDGDADSTLILDKNATADDANILLQTGSSTRAELGLLATDDFNIKVSADGAAFTDALTIDKDNGQVGLGTTTPRQLLELSGGFIGISSTAPGLFLNETNGTKDSFIVQDSDKIIIQRRTQPYGAFESSEFQFNLTTGAMFGAPTGGFKGTGTLNCVAAYDDNSLLSCYVFDQALDGSISLVKWDRRVPDQKVPAHVEKYTDKKGMIKERVVVPEVTIERIHDPLRKFVSRIGSQYDPLTLDGYARHWREKRHLTSMPNEVTFDPEKGLSTGEWIQRLVETVEIQAVLIEHLNVRLKKLEKKQPRK